MSAAVCATEQGTNVVDEVARQGAVLLQLLEALLGHGTASRVSPPRGTRDLHTTAENGHCVCGVCLTGVQCVLVRIQSA